MADYDIGGKPPGYTDVVITTSSKEIGVGLGVRSVALLETTANLMVSQDDTLWVTPTNTAGLVMWSSRKGDGGSFFVKLASGGPTTRQFYSRDHT